MKRIVAGTTLFLILLIGAMFSTSTKTSNVKEQKEYPIAENVTSLQECSVPQKCVVKDPKKYQLKEYEGNLAIFKSGTPTPIRITSITIEELPHADQQLLKNGIEATCEEELNVLLEDYCS